MTISSKLPKTVDFLAKNLISRNFLITFRQKTSSISFSETSFLENFSKTREKSRQIVGFHIFQILPFELGFQNFVHSIFLEFLEKISLNKTKSRWKIFLESSNFTEKLTLADFLDLDKFTLLRRGNLTTQCCQMFLTIWRFWAKRVKKVLKTPKG